MDAVSEVKARLNIEDVIGEYVRLKRAGQNYKGLSPFSSEKTPSFVVSPGKQIWHDFSSGRGGDVFTFVQEVEGLDFKGALEMLARKAGVDLSQFQSKSSGMGGINKDRLYEALDAAAKFYQVQLTANKTALEYVVEKRAFRRDIVMRFRIGYSPDSQDSLKQYLLGKKFTNSEIKAAGLLSSRGSDMFRGRIMVPLFDQFGKVVGFTARILVDREGAPKYINTPSTVLYDKSRHIYGLNFAKSDIQKTKFSVLVEGNLDVISSHQAGVTNVIATAGTALTEMQLKTLSRFSNDVRLAFDEDKAGVAATERAIPIAAKTGVDLSVVTIPSGKDPDELVRHDPKIWEDVITKPVYALDWLISIYEKELDINIPVGKKKFAEKLLPVVQKLNDEIEKDHYVQKIAVILGSDVEAVRRNLSSSTSEPQSRLKSVSVKHETLDKEHQEIKKITDRILAIALNHPQFKELLKPLNKSMFVSTKQAEVLEYILKSDSPSVESASKDLIQEAEYVKIITLQFEELYEGIDDLELRNEVVRLRGRLVEYYVKDQKKQILSLMKSCTEQETMMYLEQIRDLDNLLKS